MKGFDELPAAIIGRLGEIAAAEVMRADGASTISLCRIDDGGAPMLESGAVRRDRAVLPDLQVFNLSAIRGACFVEIKTYATSIENRRGGFRAHGIPVRLFDHYVANENKTGIPVYLAINELDTGELRISAAPLSALWKDPCQCRGCRSGSRHISGRTGITESQWYFDRDDLSIVYRHSDKTIERLRKKHRELIGGHTLQRHGLTRRPRAKPVQLADDHPRDTCDDCGDSAKKGLSFIALTVEDFLGNERVVCSKCWRESQVA